MENDLIDVFTYGVAPVSIDVMKKVKGLEFARAFETSKIFMEEELPQLLEAKKASGRYKDIDDLEKLSS